MNEVAAPLATARTDATRILAHHVATTRLLSLARASA